MARRKPRTFESYLRAAIRRIWGWDKSRNAALERAKVTPGRRDKWSKYRCEECGTEPLSRKEVQVDHLIECDNPAGWDGWDAYIGRMFCPPEGLAIKCLPCHKRKTNANNALRRARKAK
jgi:hypothetical protein